MYCDSYSCKHTKDNHTPTCKECTCEGFREEYTYERQRAAVDYGVTPSYVISDTSTPSNSDSGIESGGSSSVGDYSGGGGDFGGGGASGDF